MLFDEFNDWLIDNAKGREDDLQGLFSEFFNQRCHQVGGLGDIVTDLAYQVYELQACMEGLIEDCA